MKTVKNEFGKIQSRVLHPKDTFNWAHKPGACWPGSTLSGSRIELEFDKNGDCCSILINSGTTDIDSVDQNELSAIIEDYSA